MVETAKVEQTKPISLTKTKSKDKLTKAQKDAMRDRDSEMVKGIFRFYEVPGGSMNFVYKAYEGDKVERYDMIDGEVYTVPLGVARHLNKNLWYPEYDYVKDENTKNIIRATKKVRRCGFQGLEFTDTDDLKESRIIEAAII